MSNRSSLSYSNIFNENDVEISGRNPLHNINLRTNAFSRNINAANRFANVANYRTRVYARRATPNSDWIHEYITTSKHAKAKADKTHLGSYLVQHTREEPNYRRYLKATVYGNHNANLPDPDLSYAWISEFISSSKK